VFTAHVSSAFSTPTGKVKFMDGTLATGTATLIHGLAILRKSNLSLGAHSITATYQGNYLRHKLFSDPESGCGVG